MQYFPVFLDANYINAVVIGGGDVAARKIELLLKTTNKITVISPTVSLSVKRLISEHKLSFLQKEYGTGDLAGFNLAIAATDLVEINRNVANEGKALNILLNVVDEPDLCSYITPAIIDRDPMIVAMSSSGKSPVLIRLLREQIEKIMPENYGRLADFSFKFRDHVKARIETIKGRRHFWEKILRGSIGEAVLQGEEKIPEQQLISELKNPEQRSLGKLVFIHTLEGDPDKLTLAAHRDLQFADAVLYDQSINPRFIEYVRRDADKFPQDIPSSIIINFQHALELAEEGNHVVYLLSGHNELPKNQALSLSQVTVVEHINGL
jgi:uroporphyrin-III C-methyltransferase / precorrin-2 dehydrogenase / sirohydrochlorin ferrochelatase